MTTINADVDVPQYSDALEDKDLILIHANVNAPNQYPHVRIISNSMMWHANVSVRIDLRDVPILRYTIMINVHVNVPIYSDALVDSGLIHVHVSASVLNHEPSVLMLRILTIQHASVSVQTSHQGVPTLRYSITTPVNAAVLIFADAPVDRHLTQAHANVSVPNPYQSVLTIRTLMALHASVPAHIDHRDAPIIRFSITIPASVVAPRYTDALEDSGSIQSRVDVSVPNPDFHVPTIKNLTKQHASVSAQIGQSAAPILRHLTTILVNVVVQGYTNATEDRNSTRVRVSASVPNQGQNAPQLRYSMILHANAFVRISQGDVHTHRFSTIVFVNVVALG